MSKYSTTLHTPTISYRNIRPNFYSDKDTDTTEVGSIITTAKSLGTTNVVYDNSFVPQAPVYNGTTGQITRVTSGNAEVENKPEYQYPGYLYCDGSLFKIEDYPALYSVIGNSYGGTARPGLKITNGGSGYPASGMTITFTAPTGSETDKETIEADLTVVGGIVTVVSSTKLGKRYSSDPTFTLSNAGTGTGLTLEYNFNAEGKLNDIDKDNVFTYLGETRSLGTFNVPDLKAKKILGNGVVYGPGSPTAGLVTLGVGKDRTGGKWLFDKTAQGGYFSLGSITTTDYEKVTDDTSCTISGTQTIKITIGEKRIQGAPEHSHSTYHTEADTNFTHNAGYEGDRYLAGYNNRTGRLYNWFPIGGIHLEHKHALLKRPLSDNTVATYDIWDYKGGDSGTGSYKSLSESSPALSKTGTQSGVNTSTDVITINSHGFSTGDKVLYTVGTLTQDALATNISTSNNTVTITGHGLDNTDAVTYGMGIVTHTLTSSASTVIVASDQLKLTSHNMTTGTAIKYVSTGQTAIGGLTVGFTYYIRSVDANTVTLHTTAANATAGTPVVSITSTGSAVQTFSQDGSVIGGLTNLTTYYVSEKTADTFKLAASAANATAGTTINFTSQGTGVHTFKSAGTAIGGLTTGSNYYVHKLTDDTLELCSSANNASSGTQIDLTTTGVGDFNLFRAAIVGDGYYLASGASGAGTWIDVTTIPVPSFKKFTGNATDEGSIIGGRTVTTGGIPIIEYPNGYTIKNTAQTNTAVSFPAGWVTLAVTVCGAGGTGSPGNASGNDGGDSKFVIAGKLDITAGGGKKGGANTARTDGGDGGTLSKTGTIASIIDEYVDTDGQDGTDGTAGSFWKKLNPSNPNQAGSGGSSTNTTYSGFDGSDGNHTLVSDTTNPGSQSAQSGSGSINLANSNWTYTSVQVTMAGGKGGTTPTSGGVGGNGHKIVLNVKSPANGFTANYTTGTQGTGKNSGGSGAYGGAGGSGGSGGGDGSVGYKGGGASGMKFLNSSTIIAGAGGGGGGGGHDGYSGDPGGNGTHTSGKPMDPVSTTAALYGGGGAGGQNAGCNGGGGGGGGGGISTVAYGQGSGGGGNGSASHGGGGGGGRGMSSYHSNIFELVTHSEDNGGNGYISWSWNFDKSYWTNGGGGGGSGALLQFSLDADEIPGGSGGLSGTLTVGAGAAGVGGTTSTGPGLVQYGFGEITGYEGGSSNTTVGDIIIKASGSTDDNGPSMMLTGTGAGSGGGFKLPTTQVPEVEFVNTGTGGSGGAATVTLTNGMVSAITKTNSGSAYDSAPEIRIKHGAGSGAYATCTVNNAKQIDTVSLSTLVTPSAYIKYCKIGGSVPATPTDGTQYHRWINIKEFDCTNVKRFSIKCARGNGKNGGDLPEQGGDVLKLYYNTDQSDNFSAAGLIGTLVPLPTAAEVSSDYDGSGSGTDATKWYWYSLDLPSGAQKSNTRFQIKQERPAASGSNDSGSNSDHYGICDIIYEYDPVTTSTFQSTPGAISTNTDELTYVITGAEGNTLSSGATANDAKFTLNSRNPLVPVPAIDPDYPVPMQEPYHVVKHLIKAF